MIDKKTLTKTIIATAVASILALPLAAQAFEAKLSGQVSRMVVAPDDAVGNEIQHQDIGWSGSRFRFTGSEKAGNGIEYGFRFEIQARNNRPNANGATLKNTGDNQDNRYQDLYFSGGFGKVSFGKGDGAANGSTEVDLSGTALSSSSNYQDNWGSYEVTPGKAWGSMFTMKDALSRQNRVRYDTPNFNGFSAAFSLNQGNASEIAARYKGNFGGHKFGAAIFSATDIDQAAVAGKAPTNIVDGNGAVIGTVAGSGSAAKGALDGNKIIGGSASLLLSSGFNFTVAYSEIDFEESGKGDQDATTFKVGYKTGIHAFTVDIGDGENSNGEEGDTTGFTYAVFPHPGVEIFATYRELDSDNIANAQSIDIIALGSRFKF